MVANRISAMKTLGQLLPLVTMPEPLSSVVVSGLTLDSRQVKPGYLFVAVQGLNNHGREFISQAIVNGAIAVLMEEGEAEPESAIPCVFISGLGQRLSGIASAFYDEPSSKMEIIGITGTNGKTTCSQLLAQALAYLRKPCGVIGTLGYGVVRLKGESEKQGEQFPVLAESLVATGMTTPDAIQLQAVCAQLLDDSAGYLAMEVSSHGLVQHRVESIAIDTAVFTNLSHDHLDYHGDMAAYGAAKSILFSMPAVTAAVINQDDNYTENLFNALNSHSKVLTYSLHEKQSAYTNAYAHFLLSNIAMAPQGITADLHVNNANEEIYPIRTALVGQFNLSNLLAVIAALYSHQFSMLDIVSVISMLKPVAGRMEMMPTKLGLQVVVDYAHTPDALKNTLQALASHTDGRLWCVFGCGGDRDREKRPEMAAVTARYADHIIVTNDNPRTESPAQIFADIEQGFKGVSSQYQVIENRAKAIAHAIQQALPSDTVLIAGKGHEDYQLIGQQRHSFSDQAQARLSLRQRESGGRDD